MTFSQLTMNETMNQLSDWMDAPFQTVHHIVTANPEIVMRATRDENLMKMINESSLVTADGIGVVVGSFFAQKRLKERVTGFDLIMNTLSYREEKKTKTTVFLLGAKPASNDLAVENLKKQFPHVTVVGAQHGYFDKSEEKKIAKLIRKNKPDLLLVALGCPRQEQFIHTYKNMLFAKVAVGCGGTLDVLSGQVKRAPKWAQKTGTEWAYRLIQDPKRWRRQMDIPKFMIKILTTKRKR